MIKNGAKKCIDNMKKLKNESFILGFDMQTQHV